MASRLASLPQPDATLSAQSDVAIPMLLAKNSRRSMPSRRAPSRLLQNQRLDAIRLRRVRAEHFSVAQSAELNRRLHRDFRIRTSLTV